MMKLILLYLMAFLYITAGIYHFVKPQFYVKIVPHYLPSPMALVYVSGIAEIVCGLLLLPTTTRVVGAWLTIALLVAVFPANVQMAVDYYRGQHPLFWVSIARLPLQFVLIYWAWVYSK